MVDRSRAILCAELAEVAYEPSALAVPHVRLLGFEAEPFSASSTFGFVAHRPGEVIVSFRGTEPRSLADWLTDAQIALVPGPQGSRLHYGFSRAFESVWPAVEELVRAALTPTSTLTVTGHSLGAALARIALQRLAERLTWGVQIYTFGEPRSGDATWAQLCDAVPGGAYRIVNGADIVCRVPPRVAGYKHSGGAIQIRQDGSLDESVGWWDGWLTVHGRRIDGLMRGEVADIEEHPISEYLKGLRAGLPS